MRGKQQSGRAARWLVVAVAGLVLLYANGSVLAAEGQYRGYANVTKALGEVKLKLALESRSEGAVGDIGYVSAALGAEYALGSHASVGAYYSRVDTETGEDWATEHRPYADVTLKSKLSRAEISDRNRLEVRIRNEESTLRYRNRVRVSTGLGALPLTLSVDGELFYDTESSEVNTTRLTAGVDAVVAPRVSAGVSYIYESRLANDDWAGVHGLGITLSVSL